MIKLSAAFVSTVMICCNMSLAQPPNRLDMTYDTKILVKFRGEHLSEVLRALPLEHGATLDSCYTDILQVDEIIADYGQPAICRPFPIEEGANTTSVFARWFELRFAEPVDVRALRVRLRALDQVEAVSLVRAIPGIDVGRRPSGRER